jgi:hypothetical protein
MSAVAARIGIAEKHGAKPATLIFDSDRAAANQDGGDVRIARKAARHALGQLA